MYTDEMLTCVDCGQQFAFTSGEQEFFAMKGFTNKPSRCMDCRAARKAGRSPNGGGAAVEARARCSRQPAASAAASRKFRSSRAATSRFTAGIVSQPVRRTANSSSAFLRRESAFGQALFHRRRTPRQRIGVPMSQDASRRATGIGLIVIHLLALAAFVPALFRLSDLVVLAVLAYATGVLGISLCFHRILTHRSLRLSKPLEYSSRFSGRSRCKAIRSVGLRSIASITRTPTRPAIRTAFGRLPLGAYGLAIPAQRRAAVRRRDASLRARSLRRAVLPRPLYLQLPAAGRAGLGLFALGGWGWVVWGIFARLVFTYHCTWLVNSAAHTVGYQTYRTGDHSTNCWWVALLSFGEGWHNNHHAFPFSARHGLRWFEFDPTWWHVKMLEIVRLADRVRIPSELMRRKLALRARPWWCAAPLEVRRPISRKR